MARVEGGITMGYRHYFSLADKKHCEAVRNLPLPLFNAYCSIHFPNSVEDYEGDDKHINFMNTLEQKTIFEFGKLYYDDTAERIYEKGVPLFDNAETRDYYSDYDPAIVGKEAIKEAIEIYRGKIINYYKGMLKDGEIMQTPLFGIEIKRDDIKSIDKVCRHIEDELHWWGKGALNLDEDEPRLTDSWLYEHTIFELVRLYKSIDWDKHCVLFYGW